MKAIDAMSQAELDALALQTDAQRGAVLLRDVADYIGRFVVALLRTHTRRTPCGYCTLT